VRRLRDIFGSLREPIRFYTMSASILADRSGYYRVLEKSQKGDLDITEWLTWFLQNLLDSLEHALLRIDRVLGKVVNRLLEGTGKGFVRKLPGGGRSTRYEIDLS
jgi:hypothetical protein